jgi:hypothetical protein
MYDAHFTNREDNIMIILTLDQARDLLTPHGCTIVPTHSDRYITVWNSHCLDEVVERTLEAICTYIYSEI